MTISSSVVEAWRILRWVTPTAKNQKLFPSMTDCYCHLDLAIRRRSRHAVTRRAIRSSVTVYSSVKKNKWTMARANTRKKQGREVNRRRKSTKKSQRRSEYMKIRKWTRGKRRRMVRRRMRMGFPLRKWSTNYVTLFGIFRSLLCIL